MNTGVDNIDNEFMNKSGNGNLSYIDVPVLLWYEINKVRLGVGPQVSFLTSSNLVFNGDQGDFTQNIKDNTNNIDYFKTQLALADALNEIAASDYGEHNNTEAIIRKVIPYMAAGVAVPVISNE